MVRALAALFLCMALAHCSERPRIVISSDFPPVDVIPGALGTGPADKRSDPDDVQSMVRFLVYSNDFDVEALIASAGTLANVARRQNILDLLDRYEKVQSNLRLHDPRFPAAAHLRARTKQGLGGSYGRAASEILGEGKDSEASRYIIEVIDGPDPRPIWFCVWGGSQEVAQALWRVSQERSPADVRRFVSRMRVFLIAAQDGSAQWLLDNYPDLFIIFSERAFTGMHGASPHSDGHWLNANVRSGHGPLGEAYPPTGWDHRRPGVVEGDSPSFLHVLSGPLGLSDPEHPAMGGWGGRYVRLANAERHWIDAPDTRESIRRWADARQRDFAARMDWCVQPARRANHAPVAVVNGNRTRAVLRLTAAPGASVDLSAAGSTDADGNKVSFRWSIFAEPGSSPATLESPDSIRTTLHVGDASGEVHVLLEVTDNGTPDLTSYRRAVISVSPSARRKP